MEFLCGFYRRRHCHTAFVPLPLAMERDKWKNVTAEQDATIRRYEIQNETMMQIIDGALKEEKK